MSLVEEILVQDGAAQKAKRLSGRGDSYTGIESRCIEWYAYLFYIWDLAHLSVVSTHSFIKGKY